MAKIHITSCNERLLSYKSYIYVYSTKKGINSSTCKVPKCPGRVISFMHKKELKVQLMRKHNHPGQPEEVKVLRTKSTRKQKTLEEAQAKPQELIRAPVEVKTVKSGMDAKSSQSPTHDYHTIQLLIPESQIVTIAGRRYLLHDDHRCQFSLSMDSIELHIKKTHHKTISGREFLLHDNIIKNEVDQTSQRTTIFATKENLGLLFSSDIWYVDGKFGLEDDTLFLQVWTILAKVNEAVVPLAYIFMQTRNEEEYLGGLLTLQKKAAEYAVFNQVPSTIVTDFDEATINGVKGAFPNARIVMSLYKFQHALRSKIGVLRLHDVYTNPVKRWLWCAIGLVYVPPADVVEAFEILRNKLQTDKTQLLTGLDEVASYLDTNYIRGNPELREPPRYPIEMWNIYERTLSNEVLTDTWAEMWYRKFRKIISQYTPGSLNSLMEGIRSEQNNTEVTVTIENIDLQAMGRKTMIKTKRIRGCARRYQEFKSANKVLRYMRTIGCYNGLPK